MPNRFSDYIALVGAVDPAAAGTGTSTCDTIDMSLFDEVTFIVKTGSVLATGTVDFTVLSVTATGTITTSVTDITQLSGTADSNKQVIVTVDAASLSGRYVTATIKRGTANSIVDVTALARRARYKPAYEDDLASVDEIVNA